MKKIYKWRWLFVVLITFIALIGVIITIFFPIAILIAIGIDVVISQIYRLIIVPKLKDIDSKEKEKEKELKKYEPINMIIELLEKYENIKIDDITEKRYTKKLLKLFEKLELIGFDENVSNTIENNSYCIHITTTGSKQFYIKNLNNSEMYYSKQYNQELNINVLNAFIDHLKDELNKWRIES